MAATRNIRFELKLDDDTNQELDLLVGYSLYREESRASLIRRLIRERFELHRHQIHQELEDD